MSKEKKAVKEYELALGVRFKHDEENNKIDLGFKPIEGDLSEAPVFLKEYLLSLILGTFKAEERSKTAAVAVAMANTNEKAVAVEQEKNPIKKALLKKKLNKK